MQDAEEENMYRQSKEMPDPHEEKPGRQNLVVPGTGDELLDACKGKLRRKMAALHLSLSTGWDARSAQGEAERCGKTVVLATGRRY